jgi:hypothetical protein
VSVVAQDGSTPLHLACDGLAADEGHLEVVRLLLERGADMEAKDDLVRTLRQAARCALYVCAALKRPRRCVCAVAIRQYGNTPLHMASAAGHLELVRLLLDSGANKEAVTKVCAPLGGPDAAGVAWSALRRPRGCVNVAAHRMAVRRCTGPRCTAVQGLRSYCWSAAPTEMPKKGCAPRRIDALLRSSALCAFRAAAASRATIDAALIL